FIAGNKLVYRRSVKGAANAGEFVLVDIATTSKAPAFDHARIATALNTAASPSTPYTAVTLPFQTFTYADEMKAIEFQVGGAGGGRAGGGGGGRAGGAPQAPGTRFKCTLTDYSCMRLSAPADAGAQGQGAGQGQGRAGGGRAGGQGQG